MKSQRCNEDKEKDQSNAKLFSTLNSLNLIGCVEGKRKLPIKTVREVPQEFFQLENPDSKNKIIEW